MSKTIKTTTTETNGTPATITRPAFDFAAVGVTNPFRLCILGTHLPLKTRAKVAFTFLATLTVDEIEREAAWVEEYHTAFLTATQTLRAGSALYNDQWATLAPYRDPADGGYWTKLARSVIQAKRKATQAVAAGPLGTTSKPVPPVPYTETADDAAKV